MTTTPTAPQGVQMTDSEKQKITELADLKYRFDVLSNELFHLKEYISLIDHNPKLNNETESYGKFLMRENLVVTDGLNADPLTNSRRGVIRRSHRHQAQQPTSVINETSGEPLQGLDAVQAIVQQRFSSQANEIAQDISEEKSHTRAEKQKPKVKASKHSVPDTHVKKEEHTVPISNKSIKAASSSNQPLKRKHEKIRETPIIKKDDVDDLPTLHSEHVPEFDSDYYFTTSEEELEDSSRKSSRKRPRVKVSFSEPKQTITNPLHVVHPKFGSLTAYLDSFRSLDEDMTPEEYDNFIKELVIAVKHVKDGLRDGKLTYDVGTSSIQPVVTKDIKPIQHQRPDPISYIYKEQHKHVHQDYLVNQGVHMSKLFQSTRRARIARAKKVSQMIEQHFKHIAGAEERKIKEEEKHKKSMIRGIVQALKKRWNLAERAYRVLRKDEEEQLKRIQGKKHLSKILKHSTELLEAQLNQGQSDSDETGDMSESNISDTELSSEDRDDILSSSSDEQDNDGSENDTEQLNGTSVGSDDALSVNELKRRYENLDAVSDEIFDESVMSRTPSESKISETGSQVSSIVKPSVSLSDLFTKNYDSDDASDEDDQDMSGSYESSDNSGDMELSDSDESSREESEDSKKSSNQQEKESQNNETQAPDDTAAYEPPSEQLSVVDVPIPSLLRGTLRVYQKQGLNWLASLYNNNTNGILADEMGLGKTIQTISLLAYLACEKENWGPHLIIVPTSVLLNWEMEFKRFAPGLKVLTYYGTPQQRKEKRKGWNKQDAFHVCIVSYQLVVQDQHSFKRKKWEYMILDEAHNIKNFRSTRWQALLNFNTKRRLLLTGTPLQNNLAELWSLLYFLMPQTVVNGKKVSGFADLDAFQQWFGHPVDKIIETSGGVQDEETKKTVTKLHQVLRPYLLRRLKADVEKQMPAKYEHIVYCRLSKRQRFLYDDFMARSKTRETLASGNFMSIVNCLMQLRKVCNHPDLFEVRPILTSFEGGDSVMSDYSMINKTIINMISANKVTREVDLGNLGLTFAGRDSELESHISKSINTLQCSDQFSGRILDLEKCLANNGDMNDNDTSYQDASKFFLHYGEEKVQRKIDMLKFKKYINELRCERYPVYGKNLINLLTVVDDVKSDDIQNVPLITPVTSRLLTDKKVIDNFAVLTPKAVTLDNRMLTLGLDDDSVVPEITRNNMLEEFYNMNNPFHHLQTKSTIAFPDKSLLQYDCGKLQKLAVLLQELKDNGHRALIFTQMTKVLDILEQFLNFHGYLYMRLDGATKVEDRQILTERFNSDNRVTVFILSSRSGGLGINLTGADTVIFYDSDWNPAMDKQCQDRCHRIGQTRDVHIYRFVSEHTIESNILKKANQKRQLDNVVIQEGDFTTDYFSKLSITDVLGAELPPGKSDDQLLFENGTEVSKNPKTLEKMLAQAEDADDVKAANLAMKEVEVDDEDFTEETSPNGKDAPDSDDEYEGTSHVEEYMIRLIANGYYH